MKRSIGVFDSGIGGLTVLEKLKEVLPDENFIYYGDSKNNPYGEKSDEELYEIVKGVVSYLIDLNVKLIVIACNTATTKCMKKLRQEFEDMIFVGTVPAIKMAYDRECKKTLVMATPATIGSTRTEELVRDFKNSDQDISLLSCGGLANLIDSHNMEMVDQKLEEIFSPYRDTGIDSIVLGCTHYPLIKDNIMKFFPDAILLDGALGVAKEVKRQLEKNGLLEKNSQREVKILNSLEM